MRIWLSFLLLLLSVPSIAGAWWNEAWVYRKAIDIDTAVLLRGGPETLQDVPVLVRLHAANFNYFFDVNGDGADIRFIADDDETPLKHHIERFDLINEMAFIWVKLPNVSAQTASQRIWMYYGNPEAAGADDAAGVFDVNQVAVYHFGQPRGPITDASAFNHHAERAGHEPTPGALIACGLTLTGDGRLSLPQSPVFDIAPAGVTLSAWVQFDEKSAPASGLLLLREDDARRFTLRLDEGQLLLPRQPAQASAALRRGAR